MKKITIDDLYYLQLGSAMLGSGGGGDPYYSYLMAKHQIETFGEIDLIDLSDLDDEDLICPIAVMGAPLINKEKLLSGREINAPIEALQKSLKLDISALMPGEIGGANAFAPLLIAAKKKMPVLDADLIGRAFPKLQMNSCNLHHMSPAPAVLADSLGNTVIINTPHIDDLERMARAVTIAMGSSAGIALHIMKASVAKRCVVQGSISRAIEIGKILSLAQHHQRSKAEALVEKGLATTIAEGIVTDIHHEMKNGFFEGFVKIKTDTRQIQINSQNEYLIAKENEKTLVATPDIIMLMEQSSGTLITSENIKYGLEVVVLSLPAPSIWTTKEGLALTGPEVFGYKNINIKLTSSNMETLCTASI